MTVPNYMAQLGATLVDHGLAILPIQPGTKKPGRYRKGAWHDYPQWSRHCDRDTTAHEVDVWGDWPGAGIGIAAGRVIGIDIDVLDSPALAKQIEVLAREMLGDTPAIRIGRAPKRLLVYRAAHPFNGFKYPPIEVLGRGQQFIAYGIHPDAPGEDTSKMASYTRKSSSQTILTSTPPCLPITHVAARKAPTIRNIFMARNG